MTDVAQRFKQLVRIRMIEERISEAYGEQMMRCPTYFSIGQEAVAVGVAAALGPGDVSFSAHRNHAHYLAKGGSLRALLSELYGKADGCVGGRGGSLHLFDESAGFMGSTPIVGSTIPIAVGSAFASKLRGESTVTAVFFGDGATEAGVFYESLNFAAVHRLPVLFVCENNLYSIYSPLGPRQPPGRRIVDLASATGVRAGRVDGQDVEIVYEAAAAEVARLRRGDGPAFLECMTYRYVQHVGPGNDDHLPYRSAEEIASWKARDPLPIAAARIASSGVMTEDEIASWRQAVDGEIADAFRHARGAPLPEPSVARPSV
ncbi:MAG: thiamine pyrophosphate-dependent dehydrogenase E1 component subunit alpha [Acidobacteriota bacterium]|nr:thiamine pyrophosphate-dependent dehydrogenase E1 component subunit alpha [Acidobacteriota bacterium]